MVGPRHLRGRGECAAAWLAQRSGLPAQADAEDSTRCSRRGARSILHQIGTSGLRERGHGGAPTSEGNARTRRRRRNVLDANRTDGARSAVDENGEEECMACQRLRVI